jgi:hypothetical protein
MWQRNYHDHIVRFCPEGCGFWVVVGGTNPYKERYGVIRNGRTAAIGKGNDPKKDNGPCAHDRDGDP